MKYFQEMKACNCFFLFLENHCILRWWNCGTRCMLSSPAFHFCGPRFESCISRPEARMAFRPYLLYAWFLLLSSWIYRWTSPYFYIGIGQYEFWCYRPYAHYVIWVGRPRLEVKRMVLIGPSCARRAFTFNSCAFKVRCWNDGTHRFITLPNEMAAWWMMTSLLEVHSMNINGESYDNVLSRLYGSLCKLCLGLLEK